MAAVRIKSDKELAGLGLRVDPDDATRLIPIPIPNRRNDAGSPGGSQANSTASREAVEGGDPPRPSPPPPAGGTPAPSGPIQVDPRIEAVLPPPSASEAAFLERRLLADRGSQVEFAVWSEGWRLLDDFTAYRLCVRHGIAYNVRLVDLPDIEAAIRWRLEAKLGQLNLSPLQTAWARGRLSLPLKQRPGRPRKGEERGRSAHACTDEELGICWGVDGRTVRRDRAFARALMVIEDRLGAAFRDKILSREYPLTRKQTVAWAKDIRGRVIDEGEIERRVAVILEQRRKKTEGPGATPPVVEPDQPAPPESASEHRTEPISDGAGSQDDVAPALIEPAALEVIDAPPADTPLIRLYKAWDDASDEEKEQFASMPEVYALAVGEGPSLAGGAAGA